MRILDRGGVRVARIEGDRDAGGDRLGRGPAERMVEYHLWRDDASAHRKPVREGLLWLVKKLS